MNCRWHRCCACRTVAAPCRAPGGGAGDRSRPCEPRRASISNRLVRSAALCWPACSNCPRRRRRHVLEERTSGAARVEAVAGGRACAPATYRGLQIPVMQTGGVGAAAPPHQRHPARSQPHAAAYELQMGCALFQPRAGAAKRRPMKRWPVSTYRSCSSSSAKTGGATAAANLRHGQSARGSMCLTVFARSSREVLYARRGGLQASPSAGPGARTGAAHAGGVDLLLQEADVGFAIAPWVAPRAGHELLAKRGHVLRLAQGLLPPSRVRWKAWNSRTWSIRLWSR